MTLTEEVQMFDYYADKHGLSYALSNDCPQVAADPAIASAVIQIENAERAIKARVKELEDELGEQS